MADHAGPPHRKAGLAVPESTVKGYVQIILEKLEATNRTHAVAIAFQRGLVQTDA